jgi:hypothetical protein
MRDSNIWPSRAVELPALVHTSPWGKLQIQCWKRVIVLLLIKLYLLFLKCFFRNFDWLMYMHMFKRPPSTHSSQSFSCILSNAKWKLHKKQAQLCGTRQYFLSFFPPKIMKNFGCPPPHSSSQISNQIMAESPMIIVLIRTWRNGVVHFPGMPWSVWPDVLWKKSPNFVQK